MIKKTSNESKTEQKGGLLLSITFIVLTILAGLPLAFGLAYFFAFKGRIYPYTWVCQTSLTGKTATEAEKILEEEINRTPPGQIFFTHEGQNFPVAVTPRYQAQETVARAVKNGRGQTLRQTLTSLYLLFRKGQLLPFSFSYDEEKLEKEITAIAAKLYEPAVNPEIKISQKLGLKTVTIEQGKNGEEVDQNSLKNTFLSELACPQQEVAIEIPIRTLSPKITAESAAITRERAENLLDKTIKLKLDDQTWTITDEEIINLISFKGGFNQDKIRDFTANFAKNVNSRPENALFQFENDRAFVFQPSKDGTELKEPEFAEELTRALDKVAQKKQSQEVAIPVIRTKATIATEDVNSLGIKELLANGSSVYAGSITNRVHNLTLASLKLNGILIPPGEEFSFNKTIGETSTATGYKQAYIIKEGRTILGDGGGVCQVSTTLFRAVLNAGLPITERQAHAYRVSYYEQDIGPGFDATVFDPSPDLKFKNDTPAHVLVQARVDSKNKKLIFSLYGTKDNRLVEISPARIWDKQAPPPDYYQDDPTLPVGKIQQVEHKIWGAKVAFDYKVTKNAEILYQKTFYSFYRPWQAIYLRGTAR